MNIEISGKKVQHILQNSQCYSQLPRPASQSDGASGQRIKLAPGVRVTMGVVWELGARGTLQLIQET